MSDRSNQYILASLFAVAMVACDQRVEGTSESGAPGVPQAEVAQAQVSAVSNPGEQKYLINCAACHQANGHGLRGAFPPLAKSDYFGDDNEKAIRATIQGLSGPITVNGTVYNAVMPPMSYLSDQDLADILTYVMLSWGNTGEPVTRDEVAAVRTGLGRDPG